MQSPSQELWPLGGQTYAGWLHSSPNGWLLTRRRGGDEDDSTGEKHKYTEDVAWGVLMLQCVNFLVRSDSKLWLGSSALMSKSMVDNGRKLLLIGVFSSC